MRFIDLFAGVGGFRLGLEKTGGFECVWSCEIDRYCQQVYKYHWGEVEAGDVRRVDTSGVPDFDLLCAGFPCQAFSIAGKRLGFNDTRGTLFFEIARLLKDKRPRYLLLENVKGLLSHDSGKTFGRILGVLADLGYELQWQVLNSKDFGVPQNRERVFIVGHLGGEPRPQVFPVLEVGSNDFQRDEEETRGEVANTITGGYSVQNARGTYIRTRSDQPYHQSNCVPSLRQSDKAEVRIAEGEPMIVADRTRTYAGQGRNLESPKPMTNALSGVQKDNLLIYRHPLNYGKKSVYSADEVHPSLRTVSRLPSIANTVDQDGYLRFGERLRDEGGKPQLLPICRRRIRRLTPRECERLQGFPDDFTRYGVNEKGEKVEISDTQRYRMMGNAVTVNVVEFLGRLLLNTQSSDFFTDLGDHLYAGANP